MIFFGLLLVCRNRHIHTSKTLDVSGLYSKQKKIIKVFFSIPINQKVKECVLT